MAFTTSRMLILEIISWSELRYLKSPVHAILYRDVSVVARMDLLTGTRVVIVCIEF
jgi:hypothetical protein